MRDTVFAAITAPPERRPWSPRLLSLFGHVTIISIALIPAAPSPKLLPQGLVHVVLHAPTRLTLPINNSKLGGGGGGRRQPARASLGKLPRPSNRQLVPPSPEPPKNPDPTLIVEPTIVAPELAFLPRVNLLTLGDPNGMPGPPSSGPGCCVGMGSGNGPSIGDNRGPGYGDKEGLGGFHIGGGVTAPVLITQIMPEYSEEARKARYEGTVLLETIVLEDGSVRVRRIARGVGFGLDQKAIEAVLQWKFRPGRMNGRPVPVALNVEVNFNLR